MGSVSTIVEDKKYKNKNWDIFSRVDLNKYLSCTTGFQWLDQIIVQGNTPMHECYHWPKQFSFQKL